MIWLGAVTIAHNFIPHFTDKQKSALAYLASLISQFPVGPLVYGGRYFSSSSPTSSLGPSPLFHCRIEGPGNEAAFVPRNGPTNDWRMRLVSDFSFFTRRNNLRSLLESVNGHWLFERKFLFFAALANVRVTSSARKPNSCTCA